MSMISQCLCTPISATSAKKMDIYKLTAAATPTTASNSSYLLAHYTATCT